MRRQTDDQPAASQILAGYVLISRIYFPGHTLSQKRANFIFYQLTSVQRRLRAVKSHLFAWAVLYLNIASCSEK